MVLLAFFASACEYFVRFQASSNVALVVRESDILEIEIQANRVVRFFPSFFVFNREVIDIFDALFASIANMQTKALSHIEHDSLAKAVSCRAKGHAKHLFFPLRTSVTQSFLLPSSIS